MTFVTYAQNFEDVMLRRALHDVDNGVYVDVGAQDPDVFSVTRTFYEQGWRGVNIDAVKTWYDACCRRRPEDTNVNVAISDQPGKLVFHEVEASGLSTANAELAQKYREGGFTVIDVEVPMITLSELLTQYGVRDIHFLKVDVEGEEVRVLAGMDFQKWRPWIVVIEATEPGSPELVKCEWEPALLSAGYERVYFDGLNLYYLAKEHAHRKQYFAVPPNVFDGFVSAAEDAARNDEVRRQQEVMRLTRGYAASQAENARLTLRIAAAEAESQALLVRLNNTWNTRRVVRAVGYRVYPYLLKAIEAGSRLTARSPAAKAVWMTLRPVTLAVVRKIRGIAR